MKGALILALTLVSCVPTTAQAPALVCGQTLYIETMENGLDGYLRAQLIKIHFQLPITTDKEKADLLMTGASTRLQDHWYNSGVADHSVGNISIIDRKGTVVWSGSAGDRNIWWGSLAKHGPEKVAERIVSKLAKVAPQACQKGDSRSL